jgi:predicted hydrocarbon binding protein
MLQDEHKKIHDISYFLAALAHGAEIHLGRGTAAVCSLAGKKFGKEAVENVEETSDPLRAVEILREALADRGIMWEFAPFEGDGGAILEEDGKKKLRLVFKTCMVRNSLFTYAHEQKQSLCYMAHGVFAGAMEKVMHGCKVQLEIIHAGPNACLKEMIWEESQ